MYKQGSESKKNAGVFLRNPWTIGIASPVVAYLITSVIASIASHKGIFSSFWTVAKWIGRVLSFLIFLRIPLWIILLGIVLVVVISRLLAFVHEQTKPWRSYKIDYFRDWLFIWDYTKDGFISSIQTICSNCRCVLSTRYPSFDDNADYLYCPNCGANYKSISTQDLNDVEKIIVSRIRSGEYKNSRYFGKNRIENDAPRP